MLKRVTSVCQCRFGPSGPQGLSRDGHEPALLIMSSELAEIAITQSIVIQRYAMIEFGDLLSAKLTREEKVFRDYFPGIN